MNGDLSQGGDGIISGTLVSGNRIYNNGVGGGSGINMDGVKNSRIENNLIYGNHASGISLYKIDGTSGSTGNTVHLRSQRRRWALNIQSGSRQYGLNILATHPGAIDISADSMSGFVSDYNAVISRFTTDGGSSIKTLAQWQASTGKDVHSLVATAANLFVNPGGNDYHLLTTSPAKNAGTSQSAPPADFDGLPRKAGAAIRHRRLRIRRALRRLQSRRHRDQPPTTCCGVRRSERTSLDTRAPTETAAARSTSPTSCVGGPTSLLSPPSEPLWLPRSPNHSPSQRCAWPSPSSNWHQSDSNSADSASHSSSSVANSAFNLANSP